MIYGDELHRMGYQKYMQTCLYPSRVPVKVIYNIFDVIMSNVLRWTHHSRINH